MHNYLIYLWFWFGANEYVKRQFYVHNLFDIELTPEQQHSSKAYLYLLE